MLTGFVFQTRLGHGTNAGNLKSALADRTEVVSCWRYPEEYKALVDRLPFGPKGWRVNLALGGYLAVRPVAHRLRAALFHTQDVAPFTVGMMRRLPSVVSLDSTHLQLQAFGEHYYGGGGTARAEARKMRLYGRVYTAARHIVSWSQWAKDSLVSEFGVPPDKISVIPPGLNLGLFRPASPSRAGGAARLLFVGGDFGRKGGDLLLRWARERAGGPWEMHVVTRSAVPETPGLTVHRGVTNNSPELVRLYQGSDAFVLPTLADCYSLVAMEAMACGLPVVISDVGGIGDIVADGETGYLTPPGDYDALAARLDALVEDAGLRRRLGAAGLERAQARFGLDNYRRLLDLVVGVAR